MGFSLKNDSYTFTTLTNNDLTITLPDGSHRDLQDTGSEAIDNNFKYLRQLLFEYKKELSFLDFIQLTGYVTTANVDSIYSMFYELAPGECIGIDVDSIVFNESVSLNRGDFLLKKENGEPLRVAGPSSLIYIPKLTRGTNSTYLNFYSDSDPNVNTDYKKIVIPATGNPYAIKMEDASKTNPTHVAAVWDSTHEYWKVDNVQVTAMEEYVFEYNASSLNSYNYCFTLTKYNPGQANTYYTSFTALTYTPSGSSTEVKLQPIVKSYYNDEEIFNVVTTSYNSTSKKYTITNISNLDSIVVEVK